MFEFARISRNLQSHSRIRVRYFVVLLRVKLEIWPKSELLLRTSLVDEARRSRSCAIYRNVITNTYIWVWILVFLICDTDFQLNSHLTTLASIHKIHHTLHRLVNTCHHFWFTCMRFYIDLTVILVFWHRIWQKTLHRKATNQVNGLSVLLCFCMMIKLQTVVTSTGLCLYV